jgi:ATP-dependent helicase HrpB
VLLAFAYPDRIAALRHSNSGTYLLSNGKGGTLHKEDELYDTSYLVICDLDAKSTNATIYKACEITRGQIEEYLELESADKVTWNEEQQRVEARNVQSLGAIILKERQITPSSKTELEEEIHEVLLDELEALGLDVLHWNKEALSLKARVTFLNHHNIDFPDFSDETLLENMDKWLAPYLTGINTLKACQNLNLLTILLGQLSFEQTQTLNSLAPAKLKVASGSNINIDYNNPEQPYLAVRLQEMFGTKHTPTLLNGKVKLMIHLLSPASRPMQVTQDLESFWENTYDEVKKELRGKYKRHYWPDDPLEAQATSKTKKRM